MFDVNFVYGVIEGLEFKDNEAFVEWLEENTSKKMRSNQFISSLEYLNNRIAIDWRGVEWDKADWPNGDYGLLGGYIEQLLKKLAKSGHLPHGVIVAAREDPRGWVDGWRRTFECKGKKLFMHTVDLYWDEWIGKYGDNEELVLSVIAGETLSSLTDAAIALEELKADLGRKVSKMPIDSKDFVNAIGITSRNCLGWIMDQIASRVKATKGSDCRCERRWSEDYEGDRYPVLRLDDCYCGLAGDGGYGFSVTSLEAAKMVELPAGDFE